MTWQFSLFVIPLFLNAILAAAIGWGAWSRRGSPGARLFAYLMLATGEWSVASILEATAVGLPSKVLWAKVEYLGIVGVGILLLMFVVEYTRQARWLTRRNTALLWVIPVVTLALVWTNEWHGLIWSSIMPSTGYGDVLLTYQHGVWFLLFAAYNYVAIMAGILVLVLETIRYHHLYRLQAITLIAGVILPLLLNFIYLSGLSPVPGLDLTPFGFTLAGLIFAFTLFRYRLFDLAPIARDSLVEKMRDGVLVVDAQNRIVDLNLVAQRWLATVNASLIGQSVEKVLPIHLDPPTPDRQEQETHSEITLKNGELRYLDLDISPLYDQYRRLTGRLLVLRDSTARKLVEMELARVQELNHRILEHVPEGISVQDAKGFLTFVNPALAAMVGRTPAELAGKHWNELVPTDQRERVREAVSRYIENKPDQYEIELLAKDGTRPPVLVSGSPRRDPTTGEHVETVSVYTHIGAQKSAARELETRSEQMTSLFDIAQVLTSGQDINRALQALLAECQRVLPVDAFAIAVYDAKTGLIYHPLYYEHGHYLVQSPSDIRNHPGLSGYVILERRTIYLPDTLKFETTARFGILRSGGEPARSYVGVPLILHDQVVGVISMQSNESDDYTPDQIHLLETIAPLVAMAIENGRLPALAQQEMRRRKQVETVLQQARGRIMALETELRKGAIVDPLTGLFSPDYSKATLWREFKRAEREARPISVVLIEQDRLHEIIDTFGDKAGDQVLKALADLLGKKIRASDIACRYNQEQLLVMMPGASIEIASRRAEQWRTAFARMRISRDGKSLGNTLSLGIAAFPAHGATPEQLLQAAEHALDAARAAGRNCIGIAVTPLPAEPIQASTPVPQANPAPR
ncbi:MAG: histidine kinase N-terminal 7TM domain-containing protein [Anaerolineae bacterium]